MTIYQLEFLIKSFYKKIKNIIQRRNHLVRKTIPYGYKDARDIILDVALASIIQMVEIEKCFEKVEYDKKDKEIIETVYDYASRQRPKIVEEINFLLQFSNSKLLNEEYENKEREIYQRDKEFLLTIAENYTIFWI